MTTEYWEIWYPKAGATGLLLARGLADATQEILLHSAPEVVTAEVRDQNGARLAYGSDLERTLVSPMCLLRRQGQLLVREDFWPTDADLDATVLMPGGEVGILKSWWHSDDKMRWRWQVEFYNAIDSGTTTAPAVEKTKSADRGNGSGRPAFMGATKSGPMLR